MFVRVFVLRRPGCECRLVIDVSRFPNAELCLVACAAVHYRTRKFALAGLFFLQAVPFPFLSLPSTLCSVLSVSSRACVGVDGVTLTAGDQ